MKKIFLILSMSLVLLFGSLSVVISQDQPKPKKDTVNMDTDAKPKFYYAAEDEAAPKKGNTMMLVIGVGVIIVAAGTYFLLKKKK